MSEGNSGRTRIYAPKGGMNVICFFWRASDAGGCIALGTSDGINDGYSRKDNGGGGVSRERIWRSDPISGATRTIAVTSPCRTVIGERRTTNDACKSMYTLDGNNDAAASCG